MTYEKHARIGVAQYACGARVRPGSGDSCPDRCWVRCGQFDVKTDKSQHPQGQVPLDKALVYVFEVERTDAGAFKIGAVTIRIGFDGQWVGANHGNTYFYFPVDPGDHNLCANWQSNPGRLSKLASAVSLTAETGQVYYFLTKVDERSHDYPAVWLEAVDPAEAKLLIASSSLSNFHPKK